MQRNKRLELTMGGTSRPLLFDFTFLDFLTETTSLSDLDEVGAKRPWRLLPIIALAGLQSGADFEGKKEKLDLKTVTGWVEDMEPLEASKILEGYKSAMGFIGAALTGVPAGNPAP